jgi:tyrosyl-tRNA synthetase
LGRHFQQRLGSAPQVVITSTITPGLDGGPKQSKSLNNYIALTDSPRDKFGKVMSLPDSLIQTYAHVYTELPLDVVAGLGEAAIQGGPPAREAKLRLASAIVTRYHGANTAKAERATFIQLFSEGSRPTDLPEVFVDGATVLELLEAARPGDSRSELRRLISQGAVSLDDRKVSDPNEPIILTRPTTLRSGRRTWHRLIPRA